MIGLYPQDYGKKIQRIPEQYYPLHTVHIFIFIACFFIIFIIPIYADTNPLKTHLQQSFNIYEESIYENYSSIEFIDTIEYKKVINDTCITHYIKTAFYKIDLVKRRIHIKILYFHLIDGKNEKNRYAGMESETPLDDLYLFSEYIDKRWDQTYINKEESYISFKGTKWFIPLFITFHYDKDNYFPEQISVISDDNNIDLSMNYSKNSGIYLLDELVSTITLNFVVVIYNITAHITRTNYVLR